MLETKEVWKDLPIEEYKGLYLVSNKGRLFSVRKSKIFSQYITNSGYMQATLTNRYGVRKHEYLHRLVAMAFIENPNNLPQVNHINEIKVDNRVENLEWVSAKDNINYGTGNERRAKKLSVAIDQFDLDGNFIRTWQGAREVEKELGYKNSSISKCLNGKYKTAYNFIWKYHMEE